MSSRRIQVAKQRPPPKWIVSEKRLSRKTGHVPQPRTVRVAQPRTADEVREQVREAARKKKTVVCVGARHSFSDLDRLSAGAADDQVWMLRMHFAQLDDDVQTQKWHSVAEYREGIAERLLELQQRQRKLTAEDAARTSAEHPFHLAFIGRCPYVSTHLRVCARRMIAAEPRARFLPPKKDQPPLNAVEAAHSCPVVRRTCCCELEHYVVRVGASVPLSALHVWLEAQRMSLPNTGQVAHQSVAGAVSTATHGSGPFPPLSSLVLAIELVDDRGRLHRIEPGVASEEEPSDNLACTANVCFGSASPTPFDDPQQLVAELHSASGFPVDQVLVHRNDEYFRAAVVNLGCMGCVTSVTLLVQDLVFLKEQRLRRKWKQIRSDLLRGQFLPHLPLPIVHAADDQLRTSTSSSSVLASSSMLSLDFSQHSLLGSFGSDGGGGSDCDSDGGSSSDEQFQNDQLNFGCLARTALSPCHDAAAAMVCFPPSALDAPCSGALTPPGSPPHSPRDTPLRLTSPRGPRDHSVKLRTRVLNRNFEFFLNPYNMSCMKIVRHEVLLESETNELPDEDRMRSMPHHLSHAPLFTRLVREVSSLRASSGELWIDVLINMQSNESFVAPPSMALHSFAPEDLRVMSTETAVPCGSPFPSTEQEKRFEEAFPEPKSRTPFARASFVVEYTAAAVRRLAGRKLTLPLNFRYCTPSEHYLSMTHSKPEEKDVPLYLMVELPLSLEQDSKRVNKVHLVAAHLERYLVRDLAGRPHWAKVQRLRLASRQNPLSEPYATNLSHWNRVRRELDPSGTFSTPFASQSTVGLIRHK